MASLTDIGEEYWTRVIGNDLTKVSSFDVGLYNQSTDSLSDVSDLGDLTTEPSGSAYARQTVSLPGDVTISNSGGDWQIQQSATESFDTSDSSQSVDAYFYVVNFQSNEAGDSSANDHMLIYGDLDSSYDLSSIDSFNLDDTGISQT